MSQLNNADYYRRRAAEAQAHAAEAVLPEVRCVHREMAERYAQLVAEAERSERPAASRPVLGIVTNRR